MSGRAQFEREKMDAFVRYWEDLFEEFPKAKKCAVEAMGEATQKHLYRQISRSGFHGNADYTVSSWQVIKVGSGGGYATVKPKAYKWSRDGGRGKPKFWKGVRVTTKMVTKWQERGYATRKPSAGSSRAWNTLRGTKVVYTAADYVPGKQFYSYTKLHAADIAIKAAEQVLERISWSDEYFEHLKQEFNLS